MDGECYEETEKAFLCRTCKENKLQLQRNLVEMEKIEIKVDEKYISRS